MTLAGSPGAAWISRKLATMMANTIATILTSPLDKEAGEARAAHVSPASREEDVVERGAGAHRAVRMTLCSFLSWIVGQASSISQICGTSSHRIFCTSVKAFWRTAGSRQFARRR